MATPSTYGATNTATSHTNHHILDSHTEELSPLLSNKKQHVGSPWHRYINANLSKKNADLILLFSYITTGLLDSTATAVWGSFVSMQTGNTIYLGLGLADPTSSTRWVKSGVAILSFCFGSFCFARYHRRFEARKRWVLLGTVFFQLLCIVVATIIVMMTPETSPGGGRRLHWHVLLPLALVSFQSSGQAVISRALEHGSLTSVVLTSIYCDLFSDAKLFASLAENAERNRRTAAPLLLLVGAIMGGLWQKTEIGIVGALWTAVGLKGVVVATWVVWPAEREDEGQD